MGERHMIEPAIESTDEDARQFADELGDEALDREALVLNCGRCFCPCAPDR
jgi:hypothetical protein